MNSQSTQYSSSPNSFAAAADGNKYYMSVFEHSPMFNPLDWNSLYIHTLPAGYHTQIALTKLLETQLCIGIVKRIDLVHKKHKDGEVQYNGYSAFIHFTHWFQNDNVDYLRKSITDHGVCDVSGVIISKLTGIGFVDAFGKLVYVRFSKNTKPIPKIEFNTQQISEKLVVAENTIIQQQLTLTRLEHQMEQVMKLLSNVLSDKMMNEHVYNGPPGFESDEKDIEEDKQEDSESSIDDDKLLEALTQEPDESEYVNVSGIVDFDEFVLLQQQQQSVGFKPIQKEREHFRIDELKTENTFWSETVFSHTSLDSYP